MSDEKLLPYPLGRVIEHDPLSMKFPARTEDAPLQTVEHQRRVGIFDQGNLGSCTGNACAGALMTDPIWNGEWAFDETEAVKLYSSATRLDRVKGFYPPDDTGSSGLAVAKAAQRAGFITAYHHAFGLAHTLGALMLGPVLIGIPWYESMFRPDEHGVLTVGEGGIAGGHELCLVGYNVDTKLVKVANSWGPEWGDNGYCYLHETDLKSLLKNQGDATVLVR